MSKSNKNNLYAYNPNKQLRNWDIMTYCDKSFIQSVLDAHSDVIRAYAYIYHDKFSQFELEEEAKKNDVDISDAVKVPHYHLVLRLTRPFKLITIKNWFFCVDAEGNKITTRLIDKEYHQAFRYLTHQDDPQKYQFSKTEIICNDLNAFRSSRNSDEQISIDIIDDMLNEVPIYEILQRYGNNFAYHINHYKLLFDLIYYGKEFVEIRDKYELKNYNRTFTDVNKKLTSVEDIKSFERSIEK